MTEPAPTEQRNPHTVTIDDASTLDVLRMLNDEDRLVPGAVREVLPDLAVIVDLAADRWRQGGRIHYFGAGTSGRIGALDAAELPPTFSVPPDRVIAHVAGGIDAVLHAREELEDDRALGTHDAMEVRAEDIVFGLTASGGTPYVLGALEHATTVGALTVAVTGSANPALDTLCHHHLLVATGPEPLTGSTRLKAATAQKLVVNGFSTALMVQLGMTFSNLMVDLAPGNEKLRARAVRVLVEATGSDEADCRSHLARADGRTKVALLTLMGHEQPAAEEALDRADGNVRAALELLTILGTVETS